jgi:Cysteine rich repeat
MLSKKFLIIGAALLLSTSGAMAQQKMSAGARAVLQACKPDIARFCGQVPPGQGRIKACMKEHVHELSEPCKEALFQAWLKQ